MTSRGYYLNNVGPSWRQKKRLYAQFSHDTKPDKIIHFGYKGGITYIDYEPGEIYTNNGELLTSKSDWINMRDNYINRHRVNEEHLWRDPFKPATLSRYILWGNSTDIDRNITAYKHLLSNT